MLLSLAAMTSSQPSVAMVGGIVPESRLKPTLSMASWVCWPNSVGNDPLTPQELEPALVNRKAGGLVP